MEFGDMATAIGMGLVMRYFLIPLPPLMIAVEISAAPKKIFEPG